MGRNVEDYVPPYEGVDHKTLWDQLNKPAGDPEQVDGLAAHWSDPIRATLDDFTFDLDRDLGDLMAYWSVKSAGGKEFKRRMDLVVKYADELSGHVGVIKENLETWSAALRKAQTDAPDPADTDDSGRTVAGAAIGTAVAGPVGGLIGGMIGHSQDEEQKKEAKGNMIRVIAALALEYDTAKKIEKPPPFPPSDLPDSTSPDSNSLRTPDGTTAPTAKPFSPQPDTSAPTYVSNNGPGTLTDPALLTGDAGSLLGAGNGTLTGLSAGATGSLGLVGGGGAALAGGSGVGLGGGAGAGLFGGMGGAAAGRGTSPNGLASASNAGAAKPPPPATKAGPQGKAPMRTGAARPVEDDGDEAETYDTWLTEDDMVWGSESDTPPSVLSARGSDDAEAVEADVPVDERTEFAAENPAEAKAPAAEG